MFLKLSLRRTLRIPRQVNKLKSLFEAVINQYSINKFKIFNRDMYNSHQFLEINTKDFEHTG